MQVGLGWHTFKILAQNLNPTCQKSGANGLTRWANPSCHPYYILLKNYIKVKTKWWNWHHFAKKAKDWGLYNSVTPAPLSTTTKLELPHFQQHLTRKLKTTNALASQRWRWLLRRQRRPPPSVSYHALLLRPVSLTLQFDYLHQSKPTRLNSVLQLAFPLQFFNKSSAPLLLRRLALSPL